MVDEDVAAVAETVTHGARAGAVAGDRSYLLVIENASSWTFTLPANGAVIIGRGPEAELRLHNASVSRTHTRILLDHDAVRVHDLESYNGTRVNGEPIVDTRGVTTGDVITIGDVVLVMHAASRPAAFEESLDERAWRRRLAVEVERAVAFRRPLAIAVVTGADRTRLALVTRTIDVLGRSHLGEHLLLFPETDAAEAARMVEVIACGGVKVGVASCPFDAVDPDSLVIAGRAALRSAEPVGRAADAVEQFALGEREILVGHPAMAGVLGLLKRLAAVTLRRDRGRQGERGVRGPPLLAARAKAVRRGQLRSPTRAAHRERAARFDASPFRHCRPSIPSRHQLSGDGRAVGRGHLPLVDAHDRDVALEQT